MARRTLLIVVAAALALTLTVGGAAAAPSVRIVLSEAAARTALGQG